MVIAFAFLSDTHALLLKQSTPHGLRAWKQTTNAASRHYFLYDGHIVVELSSTGNLLSAGFVFCPGAKMAWLEETI